MTDYEKLLDALAKRRAAEAQVKEAEAATRAAKLVINTTGGKVILGDGEYLLFEDGHAHRLTMSVKDFSTLVSKLIAAGVLKIETASEVVLAGGAKP